MLHASATAARLPGSAAVDRTAANSTDSFFEKWATVRYRSKYEITAFGIELLLNRHEWTHDCGNGYDCQRWKELTLLQIPVKMLTTGEFAQLRGVEDVTVRQWIRRGKIRTAVKYGNE